MVDCPTANSSGNTSLLTRPITNRAFRCIQPGLGSSAEWQDQNRGCVESPRINTPHQLSAAFLAIKAFRKTWQNLSVSLDGQYDSSELLSTRKGEQYQKHCANWQ